jgi:predicted lipid carrier protein YhbT
MQSPGKPAESHPIFPAPLSLPLRAIPSSVHNRALVTALNRIFSTDLKHGELDFMQEKLVHISIDDTGVEYRFTLKDDKLIPGDVSQRPDLSLKGTVYDYLLLASRREDTDTLFFSRRLHMQGDTELGLCVKNFLDGLDMDSHRIPAYLESVLQKSLPLYERLFSQGNSD